MTGLSAILNDVGGYIKSMEGETADFHVRSIAFVLVFWTYTLLQTWSGEVLAHSGGGRADELARAGGKQGGR